MSVDLNIEHYDLEDILNLFRIPANFDEAHLKRAKQVVLKTHPDKSGLAPDYFIFYSKAYKMLYSIWEFKKSATTETIDNYNTDYDSITYNEEQKKELLDEFFTSNKKKFKNTKDFNSWFNQQFEKNKLEQEGDAKGYEDWLRGTQEGEPTTHATGLADMAQQIDRKKAELRSLIVREDVQDITSRSAGTNIINSAPQTYDSDLFSQLSFQDLHKAHTQSVIPVTEEDYLVKQKFGSVNEFAIYRSQQDTKPLSEQQAMQYLKHRTQSEDTLATKRAYQLAKEAELVQKREQDFWASIQRIQDR
uniref:J domain-containing protein n=1 Tax=viral metagenome TaxID=1070528 RepID=A0A6C0BAW3_9ZZZZ